MSILEKNTRAFKYPFDPAPALGGYKEIISGVYWIRLPIPYKYMDHVNVWLMEDDDGWTLVDTGLSHQVTKDVWQHLFGTLLENRPIKRILCTHHHPDHVGLAEWFSKLFNTQILMTEKEYLLSETKFPEADYLYKEKTKGFYQRHGFIKFPSDVLPKSLSKMAYFKLYNVLDDGEIIAIGKKKWKVMITGGHTPQHFLLFCEKENILIGGDLLLPTIACNIGVYPIFPEADPLTELFETIKKLQKIPEDVLVLPSHETPYSGLSVKLKNSLSRYELRLKKIKQVCKVPKCAYELMSIIFRKNLNEASLSLAMMEMIAYLNYLYSQGEVRLIIDNDKTYRYQS